MCDIMGLYKLLGKKLVVVVGLIFHPINSAVGVPVLIVRRGLFSHVYSQELVSVC